MSAIRVIHKLFIGNIPWTVSSRELKQYFAEFGYVISANVVFDKDTGLSKNYGFVTFNAQSGIDSVLNKPSHPLEVGCSLFQSLSENMTEYNFDDEIFKKAAVYVDTHQSNFPLYMMFNFFAYFNQATHGPCIMERPSMFYFEQYQKWYAWTKLGNMSKEDAKNAFLDSLNKHEPDWLQRSEEQKTFLQTGFGVSIPVHPVEEDTADDNKTAFDWLKENNLDKMKSCHIEDVNVRDENGMTLLHWAADRGFAEIADYILQDLGGDVDIIDNEGQTALHYAACCEHMPVVKVLLKHNASINVKDFTGLYPYQVAEDLAIRSLIYYTG